MFNDFSIRHIGPTEAEIQDMLAAIDCPSLATLIEQTAPACIRQKTPLKLELGIGEQAALNELKAKLKQNSNAKSLLGLGYHNCITPPVIQRNLFENPAWYTSYTPYQPEISQGRLELLFHFQTLIAELTGLPVATASLLDEGTAIAEAIAVAYRFFKGKRQQIVIANDLHPHNLQVVKTRCLHAGIDISKQLSDQVAAIVIQIPDTYGLIETHNELITQAQQWGSKIITVCDPMALICMQKPSQWGANLAVGCMQRFGTPMGNGGPHAAYLASDENLVRLLPGRMIGLSVDCKGRPAYRLALQTREQHIRREKAMSNICTAQALLANMNAAYAIWHGASGLINIAKNIHQQACNFAQILDASSQYQRLNDLFFDGISFHTNEPCDNLISRTRSQGLLIRKIDAHTAHLCFDECSHHGTLMKLCHLLNLNPQQHQNAPLKLQHIRSQNDFLTQAVFHRNRSETSMMRFLRTLTDKDLALDKAMIPLGSCTMKLNAAAEMMPVSWAEIANIHPFAPPLLYQWLCRYDC